MKKGKHPPLIGILVSKGKQENTFRGDLSFFILLQKDITKHGGIVYFFTLEDVHEDYITGYTFYDEFDKWGKNNYSFPQLIYNRISSRKEESSRQFLKLRSLYHNEKKYFINPSFFNKWESYTILSKSMSLHSFLPKTWLYSTMENLLHILTRYHTLYIKPVHGYKGRGIYKLEFDGVYYSIYKRHKKSIFMHTDFVSEIGRIVAKKQYLIQAEVQTDLINNRKYDLRILCLFENGTHQINGIGVRQAKANSIITHVPNGGHILPFAQIKHKVNEGQLQHLTRLVGHHLTKAYGFIGEYSMDIGLTTNGKPILFEVNSKPMKFDEEDIQMKRIRTLSQTFCDLASDVTDSNSY